MSARHSGYLLGSATAIIFALMAAAPAQISLAPQTGTMSASPKLEKSKPASAAVPKAKAAATPVQKKSSPAAPAGNPNADLAYGAFQNGQYLTALKLAQQRAEQFNDPKSMTLVGELYANGFGVKQDDAKAADWYKRAADLGDREAMFGLAMLKISGRTGPPQREEGAKLLAASAKLGKPAAAYNLGLLYLEGQVFPQDLKRAAELFRQAADAGNPEAQYALATFYKEGRGVEKDLAEAARLLRAAAVADNIDAEVEYAIALFNGTGTPRDVPTALSVLTRAARQNSPIAQNRLARILVTGTGAPMDKIEGFKWHLIAKTAGNGDPDLDGQYLEQSPEDRKKSEDRAKKWFGTK